MESKTIPHNGESIVSQMMFNKTSTLHEVVWVEMSHTPIMLKALFQAMNLINSLQIMLAQGFACKAL